MYKADFRKGYNA